MFYQDIFGVIIVIEFIIALFAFLSLKKTPDPDFQDGPSSGVIIMCIIHMIVAGILCYFAPPTAMELHRGEAEIEYIYDERAKKNETPAIIDSTFVYINKNEEND